MEQLELRRHATRDPDADRLSPRGTGAGRGRRSGDDAHLRSGLRLPGRARGGDRRLVPARARCSSCPITRWCRASAATTRAAAAPRAWPPACGRCSTSFPTAASGLAISHTPLVERAAFGLTGVEVAADQGVRGHPRAPRRRRRDLDRRAPPRRRRVREGPANGPATRSDEGDRAITRDPAAVPVPR